MLSVARGVNDAGEDPVELRQLPCTDLRCFLCDLYVCSSISLKGVTLRAHPIGFLLSLLVWPLAFDFVAVLPIENRPRAFLLQSNFNKFNATRVTATLWLWLALEGL